MDRMLREGDYSEQGVTRGGGISQLAGKPVLRTTVALSIALTELR